MNVYLQWCVLMAVVGLIAYLWPENKIKRADRKAEKFLKNRNPIIYGK